MWGYSENELLILTSVAVKTSLQRQHISTQYFQRLSPKKNIGFVKWMGNILIHLMVFDKTTVNLYNAHTFIEIEGTL